MKLTVRPSLLSSLSLLSALFVGVGSARAQECTADADCDENFECVQSDEPYIVRPSSTPMVGSAGGDATPAGTTAPPATSCDGDGCDDTGVNEGSGASEGSSGGAAMTSEDEAPAEDPTSEPPPPDEDRVAVPSDVDGGAAQMDPEGSSMGSCQPTILTCDENADCPEPAVCDGGECVFEIEQCEENAECGAGFVCTLFSTSGTCSTSVGTNTQPSGNPAMPATMPDGSTYDTDFAGTSSGEGTMMGEGSAAAGGSGAESTMDEKPLPPESNGETSGDSEDDPDSMSAPAPGGTGTMAPPDDMTMCTVTETRACFPALVECSSDADCSGDWTCEDMSERAPQGWGDVEKACLPPGITAALAGHVRTGGDVSVSPDSSALGGEGRPQGPTDVDGTPVNGNPGSGDMNEVESPVELGTQGGTEGSMGCSTGPGSPRGGSLTWLAALGALVFASRRRKG